MSSTPTTQPTELPVAGPSRVIIPPIPPYNPKSPKRSSRSPSQSAIRPGANERVASSAQANNVDLEMNSLPRTNPPMPPTSSAPPAYDELVDRLEDLISPPEPTRARPLGGRRSDRNPSNPGHTTSASSGGTLVASSTQGTAYVPPPPAFGVKQSPDTVSRSFFYYGFFFPLFWFMGSLVLVLKLHPIPEEICGKPPSEQEDQLRLLRATEEKWAYRCLGAAIVFSVGLGITVIAVLATRNR
ncbi:hypothetical protein FRB95_014311 [Tulasnella sp. JGI-2019a]|nr:hypothetical protein FRB95_014311 [Tulasnella sp. JGI-2019a]